MKNKPKKRSKPLFYPVSHKLDVRAITRNVLSGRVRYTICRKCVKMGADWKQLLYMEKYLVPKNNLWLKRAGLLFGFILLDYLATLIFIKSPIDEGNLLVRTFMENYGILLGLTIFDVLINLPIYLIICFNSHFVTLPSRLSKFLDPVIDVFLAWFVAGYHYSGATSWFWTAPDMIRQITGFSVYISFALIASQASGIQRFFHMQIKNGLIINKET